MPIIRKIISKYIAGETIRSFLIILVILTVIFLLGRISQLVDLVINRGVDLQDIGLIILLLLPSLLAFTIPISFLFAVLVTMSRLSLDNEITILKTSGMSLGQISIPIIVVAFFIVGLSVINSYLLLPKGNSAFRHLMYDLARQRATMSIQEKTFNDDFAGVVLYTDKVPKSGDYLEDVFITDFRHGTTPATIIAHRAYLIGDTTAMMVTLRLHDGSIHMSDRPAGKYTRVDFTSYDVKLDFGPTIKGGEEKKAGREMTAREIKKALQSKTIREKERRELMIELHERFSIPAASLVFAVLAIPAGIRKHRAARYQGFTVGFSIILGYYILRVWCTALAEKGSISPFLGAWLPDILLGIIGVYLFIAAAREHPIPPSIPFWRRVK